MKISLIGPNGSGKSTIAQALSSKLHLPILGVGDVIRNREQFPWVEDIIGDYDIASGTLLSSDQVEAIMTKYLALRGTEGWIQDGVPRKHKQLDWMLSNANLTPDVFIIFQSLLSIVTKRLGTTERLIHKTSGRVYNTTSNPPKVAGVDDVTGEPLETRTDDASAALIAQRYAIYEEDTLPMANRIIESREVPFVIIHDNHDVTIAELNRTAEILAHYIPEFCGHQFSAKPPEFLQGTVSVGHVRMTLDLH